ncbi:sensor histidine kinase [Dictyobacter aurantiacus]|uniref:histidine kinase n=1 Tax=Dictyobacter aurantiacus TaxID=1936993 RepID=A0A401ZLG9_9CHLR|nr:heavy metal sensor histidine kinase [Dictyobacter aurantiacus]GCE07717.1 two-component sensor histidine kinase [Dictyobacter aurantiacus]
MKSLASLLTTLRRSVPFSLRLQLAAWYTSAFAVLLLLTGMVFYQYLERSLEASVDTDLGLRAQQIASSLVLHQGTITLRDLNLALPGLDTSTHGTDTTSSDVSQGTLVRLLDAHGKLLGETSAFHTLHAPQSSVTQPLQGTPWQGTVLSTRDQEVRLYSRTLTSAGQPLAVIQVGESLATLHALLHQLVAALLAVGALVLVSCALGSYWLAGRSFAPMKRLAETASKIQAGDLHQRVPVPSVRDEMQYLALTLNKMLDSLDESFSRQRRFVADASHELRTPVTVIRNKADIALRKSRTPQEYTIVLQSISAETERLSQLISDLLALARGDEGQAQFERETVHLDTLIEAVAANAEELAHKRDICLSVQTLPPVTLLGDEARLIQMILNLLDNAIRYTNPGGSVQVGLLTNSSEVQFIVQDTGIGIAPEHLPHIFERFYRVDPSRTRTEGSGTGLGLSIVEWIVRKHEGSIEVSSQVGQGSCFIVHLPIFQ